ncbi:MAG: CHAT domain-containing protein [Deltaproteobacteria bacterium]|nr:CHAT domain-containing protein [Deltaproteobacteria bacterium]
MTPTAARPLPTGVGRKILAALALLLSACSNQGLEECRQLFEAEDHEAAMDYCTETFDKTKAAQAGLLAARAARALEHDDEVLDWPERLADNSESISEIAAAWRLAGEVYEKRGERELEKKALLESLARYLEAADHSEASRVSYTLFYRAWENSDYRGALEMAQETFDHALQASDAEMQDFATEALYAVLYEVGDLQGAGRVLDVVEQNLDPADRLGQVHLLLNRGALDFNRHRLALARAGFERGLALAEGLEDPRVLRSLHLNLVEVALEEGNKQDAERHLQSAWAHVEATSQVPSALPFYQARLLRTQGNYSEAKRVIEDELNEEPVPTWAWQFQHQLGLAEAALGNFQEAEAAQLKAIAILEKLRQKLGLNALKAWILEQRRRPYEELVRLRMNNGFFNEALEIAERAKARAFLDAFVRAAEPSKTGNLPRESASDRLDGLYSLIPILRSSPVVVPRPLSEVLQQLQGRTVWSYFLARGSMLLFTVQNGQVGTYDLGISGQDLEEKVRLFLDDMGDFGLAAELGRQLLPADALPPPGTTLFLSTDGPLRELPLAALRWNQRYLAENYDLVYVPSASALVAISQSPRSSETNALILGDPAGDLPGARREAHWVAAWLAVEPLIGPSASSSALKGATRARILHLATHTGLGPGGPWLSLGDGRMEAARLVDERISASLVVLAGCSSGARRGKGIWGSLAASFLAAGSETVVASLWSVEDAATQRFIQEFYRQEGSNFPGAALAKTQRRWIAAGEEASSWAPFIVIGSGSVPVSKLPQERK